MARTVRRPHRLSRAARLSSFMGSPGAAGEGGAILLLLRPVRPRIIQQMALCNLRRVALAAGAAAVLTAGGLRLTLEAQQPAGSPTSTTTPHRALVNAYCLDCHDNTTKEAGLTLEAIVASDVAEHADVWERVVKKL